MFQVADLSCTGVEVSPEAQRDITCYEVLGQMALLLCVARHCPGQKRQARTSTWCDTAAAESANNTWRILAFVEPRF